MAKKEIVIIIFLVVAVIAFLSVALALVSVREENTLLETEFSSFRQQAVQEQGLCSDELSRERNNATGLFTQLSASKSSYDSLSVDFARLNSSYSKLESEHSTLDSSFKDLRGEVDNTIGKITQYEKDIQSSMDWFKSNSQLDYSDAKTFLFIECVSEEDSGCYIKTGCPWLVNQEYLGLRYKSDYYTSDKADDLQSLDDFITSDGGDCEDYALFYKAEWNFMTSKCKSEDIFVDSWSYVDDGGRYWLDWDKDWYVDGAKDVRIEVGFPNVVCGRIYDYNTQTVIGHCIIGFTKEPIEKIEDLSLLDGAVLIEPQNGEYMGHINTDSGIILPKDGDRVSEFASYIFVIITDNDYFGYSEEESEWQSYSRFLEQLQGQKQVLKRDFWASVVH